MTLIVMLSVRPGELEAFRRYETEAARIMRRHGGALERVIVLRRADDDPHKEAHLVTFPSEEAFAAYRADDELRALADLRERAVISTDVWLGEDGERYDAP
jgi:uncharacterized protein (DUF1330 family)